MGRRHQTRKPEGAVGLPCGARRNLNGHMGCCCQAKEPNMPMNAQYTEDEPARESIDQAEGPLVLEFGASWCGICQAAQPLINQAFTDFQEVAHIKVADGSGRPLGRSFRIKLWPTLIFLRDGKEISRLVRPTQAADISKALRQITQTQ